MVSKYLYILRFYFSEYFYQLKNRSKEEFSPQSFWKRLGRLCKYIIWHRFFLSKPILCNEGEDDDSLVTALLVCVSKNNYDTLAFLLESIAGSKVLSLNKPNYNDEIMYVNPAAVIIYWTLYPFVLISLMLKKTQYTFRFFDLVFYALGQVEISKKILKKLKPSCVVFSNDHSINCRAFHLAAKELGIKSVYIQHASVISDFPELDFDLSLLEGQDSLDKYKEAGNIVGKIELVGMPKLDYHINNLTSQNKVSTNIGICLSKQDDIGIVEGVLEMLDNQMANTSLFIRKHPRDDRSIKLPESALISDSARENIFDFMSNQFIIVAGNSSVHLEAVLMNIESIYFEFNDLHYATDSYGYVRNGLVDAIGDPGSLLKVINQKLNSPKSEIRSKAKYYHALVDTDEFGKSAEKVSRLIKQCIDEAGK